MSLALNTENNNLVILQTMSFEEKYIHQKELARLRQQKFYQANKEKVNEKRRANTKLLNELKNNQHVGEQFAEQKEPEPVVIAPKIIKKATKKTVIDYNEIITLLEQLKANGIIKTDGTLKKYKGDVKRLVEITKCENINDCLKQPEEIISIIDASEFSINTKKSLYQTIVFLVDNLKLNYSKKIFDAYKKAFDVYKLKSLDVSKAKEKIIILPLPEYLEQVKTHFGENSKMYVLARLYDEVTMRDNFQLKIVAQIKDALNDKINYIVRSKSQYTLVMNDYKTSGKYGKLQIKLSKPLTTLLKQYIVEHSLDTGDYLFGDKKLSNFISVNNKLLGVKDGINYFRHAKITQELDGKDLSAEERVELAAKMNHSVIVQLRYLRNQ